MGIVFSQIRMYVYQSVLRKLEPYEEFQVEGIRSK